MARISFARRHGGHTVSLNGDLVGMILNPTKSGDHPYRFITQWGDLSEYDNLVDAQLAASEAVLLDHHYPA